MNKKDKKKEKKRKKRRERKGNIYIYIRKKGKQ